MNSVICQMCGEYIRDPKCRKEGLCFECLKSGVKLEWAIEEDKLNNKKEDK